MHWFPSHFTWKLFILALLGAAIVNADSVPGTLIWDGDVVDYGGAGFYVPVAFPIDTGMRISADCFQDYNSCGGDIDAYRGFTVTSAGSFVFTTSVNVETLSNLCDPESCKSIPSATESVDYGFNIGDLSGMEPPPATYHVYDVVTATGYTSPMGADGDWTENTSSEIYLGVGDYVLSVSFIGGASGSGDTSLDFNGTYSLVPTPEPRGDIAVLAIALLILFWLKTRPRVLPWRSSNLEGVTQGKGRDGKGRDGRERID